MELNDGPVFADARRGRLFRADLQGPVRRLYREGAESGRVMCLALHPYWIGQPHRVRYLDEVLDYVLSTTACGRRRRARSPILLRALLRARVAHLARVAALTAPDGRRALPRNGPRPLRLVADRDTAAAALAGRCAPRALRHRRAGARRVDAAAGQRAGTEPLRARLHPAAVSRFWSVSHREYGHRVGIFRLLDVLKQHGIPPTIAMDAMTARHYPWLCATAWSAAAS